jgi:hypothetical protein
LRDAAGDAAGLGVGGGVGGRSLGADAAGGPAPFAAAVGRGW